jgi:hypothetical protein
LLQPLARQHSLVLFVVFVSVKIVEEVTALADMLANFVVFLHDDHF